MRTLTAAIVLVSVVSLLPASARAADGPKVEGKLTGQVLATGSGKILLIAPTGKTLWQFKGGNCSDIWMLDNGHVLLADNNVREIDPKTDKVVWSYNPPSQKGGGTFSCQRLANGNTVVGENSAGRIVEVDKSGKVVFELKLPLCQPGSHNNLRHVRKLDNGNYLVAHKGPALVREYTPAGKVVFEVKVSKVAFSAVRLPNGNTMVGHIDCVTEYDPKGKQVWQFDKSTLTGVKVGMICGIHVLPSGNVAMGIYAIQRGGDGAGLLEVTREGKLVWRYFDTSKSGSRSMMALQVLDAKGKPLPGPALR